MAVVNIRGDRLYHEHITWDQATVLRQLGILPDYLPFPYPAPSIAGEGAQLECRVPVAGAEAAQKATDKNSVESNQMFEYQVRTKAKC
jgi:carboxymethylenebutenolidase